MGDTPSGMDMNYLYLEEGAAEAVAKHFEELSKELSTVRDEFKTFQVNMGMGNCSEGNDWNGKVSAAIEAVHNALGAYVDEVDSSAVKARSAQTEYYDMEKRNKDAMVKLNPQAFADISGNDVFPPIKPR
ncbi:hypothetical protein [Mycobacteroides abscessus]|uniref:hypothetical protein n=1 Tax=Mycobacteroides abscessus TaxID=36809 RepID=UPI0010575620|nr:hypothetical protein [Mycobacteroides abscessus]